MFMFVYLINILFIYIEMQFFDNAKIDLENQLREVKDCNNNDNNASNDNNTIIKARQCKKSIDERHREFLVARWGAKAISYVVFLSETVILSEAQKMITIGNDLAANLTIVH